MRLRRYTADDGGGGEQQRRKSWVIRRQCTRWEKRATAGWSLVRYCACLTILIYPFFLSLLCGGVRQKSRKQAQGDAKAGKDLEYLRGDNPGPFTGSGSWGSVPHFRTWRSYPEAGRRADGLGWWGPRTYSLRGFFSQASCIKLDAVLEFYSPALRGSRGGRV